MKKNKIMKKKRFSRIGFSKTGLLIFIIVVIGFAVRLYKINSPLADWHSFRQSDTAAVGRNFVKDGIDLLHPRYDDLSNMQSGQYNPQGYRMVEFPAYNVLFAILYQVIPVIPIEQWARIVSIIFACFLILSVYYLTKESENKIAGLYASLFLAIYPFCVFFTRTILPETMAISLMFLSLVIMTLYSKQNNNTPKSFFYYFFSLITFSLALLVKPTTIFFIIPLIYIFYQKHKSNLYKKVSLYFYFIIGLVPLILWRSWIKNFPEGIPASDWLITSVNTYEGLKNVFFRPAFFRWIFFERIPVMILGAYSSLLFILGLVKKPQCSWLIIYTGLASLLYLFTFQGGNVQHDYYQIIILPSLGMFVGVGANYLINLDRQSFPKIYRGVILFLIITGSIAFSWYKVKDLYNVPQDLVNHAKIIKTLTPKSTVIITDTLSDTTLLYLSDRKGFPMLSNLDDQIKHNAEYLVTSNNDTILKYKDSFPVLFSSDSLYIFKLEKLNVYE